MGIGTRFEIPGELIQPELPLGFLWSMTSVAMLFKESLEGFPAQTGIAST
jgi:hypothetical protein